LKKKKIQSINFILTFIFSQLTILKKNRPDNQKKAFVRLTPDYEALDVANKVGMI